MNSPPKPDASSGYTRRGFLKRAGLGAVALSGGFGASLAPSAVAARSTTVSTSPTSFGRIFPSLPPFAPATDAVRAALVDLGQAGRAARRERRSRARARCLLITDLSLSANNPNNPTHTAGTTFFGQFIDHDMTFDTTSHARGARQIPPRRRTPGRRRSTSTRSTAQGPVAKPAALRPERTTTSCGSDSAACSRTCRGATERTRDHRRPAQRREPDHRRPALRVHPVPQQRRRLGARARLRGRLDVRGRRGS